MLSDFVCTGQLVEELTRLRKAYSLLEDVYGCRKSLPPYIGYALIEFFEEERQ